MARPALHSDWRVEFERWADRFTEPLRHKVRMRWARAYVCGLLLPGERKSVEPMAQRVAKGHRDALHHFVAISPWQVEPLERALCAEATRLVGGKDACLLIDDTALVKKGEHSVGVAHQHCGELGKNANCQALVTTTLARGEVPVCVGMRLYLPEDWAADPERRREAGVPEDAVFKEKWRIGLDEVDRVMAQGARFGIVGADAGYGACAGFRKGLSERKLTWAVGIVSTQKVYPADVRLKFPRRRRAPGRPRKHPVPSVKSVAAREMIGSLDGRKWRSISWRRGTKGPLRARFCAVRVKVADGPKISRAQHLPGDEELWLVAEKRAKGEIKYHLSNLPASALLRDLARVIKARWACEQPHQQMKEELGLDHFEGRSWRGLHHHTLLTMIAFAFLQHLRLGGKKNGGSPTARRRARVSRRSGAGSSRS
jgi:SRSO17 transposase